MMVVSLILVLNFSIVVSASSGYDRQEADTCITISQRLSVKGGRKSKWWHEGYVDNLSDTQNILGVKQSNKGLSTLGSSTRQTAMSAGKAWVGENYSTITDNLGEVIGYSSSDGMRAFRIQYKNREGIWRANFQENIMVLLFHCPLPAKAHNQDL